MDVLQMKKPEVFVLDDSCAECGFLNETRVDCTFYGTGHVQINKIETFNERFQVWKDITVEALAQPVELEQLRNELINWKIGLEFERICFPKQKQYENDDLPPGAA